MAGKRRKNRKHRKHHKRLIAQFNAHSLQQHIHQDFDYQEQTAKQKEYRQRIASQEEDVLSRTVFVTNVKNLNITANVEALKMFLTQTYGPVYSCKLEKRRGRESSSSQSYPAARVRFQSRVHAERIFNYKSLNEVRKSNSKGVKIACQSVWCKGYIYIKPSYKFHNMVDDEISGSMICLSTEGFALGHWFPAEGDATSDTPWKERLPKAINNEWLEEKCTTLRPVLRIDLKRTVVELDFTYCNVDQAHENLFEILGGLPEPETNVMSFRFKDLVEYIELCQGLDNDGRYELIFSLKHPPRLKSSWTNPTSFREFTTRLTSLVDIQPEFFGRCMGYKLCVSQTAVDKLLLNYEALERLKNFKMLRYDLASVQHAMSFDTIALAMNERNFLQAKLDQLCDHSWRTSLLLRSFLDSQRASWYHVLHDYAEIVGRRDQMDIFDLVKAGLPEKVENILSQMRTMHGRTRYPAKLFYELYQDDDEIELLEAETKDIPSFCVELPRLLVTPCRSCVTGFEMEMSNRVVRHFLQSEFFHPEAFLRVTVGDENGDKLFPDDLSDFRKSANSPVANRIQTLLLEGVRLNGRHYEFLAFSSSQLKEFSLWMVCPNRGWTIERMRQWMGDFSMCKTPSKYAARIGQCFSTTFETELENNARLRVKDDFPDIVVYKDDREMCHSDGVGLIRREYLEKLVKQLPFRTLNPSDVSAVQIRFGGAKGVLTAWDFNYLRNRRSLMGYDVCLRPSMVKFSAPYRNLEVITVAKHVPYYLNRNVILLLGCHGVKDNVFLNLQDLMFRNLNGMLNDPKTALKMIPRLGGLGNDLKSILIRMIASGLSPQADPFIFSCLHAARAHELMGLRKKARIFVEKGVVLIGGIDETGLVPEGCVFVLIRKSGSSPENNPLHDKNADYDGFEPLVGRVMVTKHPVMHPGDTRMLEAVDVPALRGHKNIILFSQMGKRPEADKMSGSDLDGDQFAVTWDERLFLNKNVPPMDYSPAIVQNENTGIDDRSLIKHFIDFARNDNLGRISMLWLDYAVMKKSACCDECLQLAKLASVAVDFPKSGVPAILPRELCLNRDAPRAHWREKKETLSFHCDSSLGQLYDQVIDEVKSVKQMTARCKGLAGRQCDKKHGQILILTERYAEKLTGFRYFNRAQTSPVEISKKAIYNQDIPLRLGWKPEHPDNKRLHAFASEQRESFEERLLTLMNKYQVKSEGEIMTGSILKYHKLHKRRRHDVSQEIKREVHQICSEYRAEFFSEVWRYVNRKLYEDDKDNGQTDVYDSVSEEESEVLEASDEDLEWIEEAVTKTATSAEARFACAYARKLAAVYYMESYSPEMHWRENNYVLFSFPWAIAADVIHCGLTI